MANVWVNYSQVAEQIAEIDDLISRCNTVKYKMEAYGKRMTTCAANLDSGSRITTERMDTLISLIEVLRDDMSACVQGTYKWQTDDASSPTTTGPAYTYVPGGNRVPVTGTTPTSTTTPFPTNGGAGVATSAPTTPTTKPGVDYSRDSNSYVSTSSPSTTAAPTPTTTPSYSGNRSTGGNNSRGGNTSKAVSNTSAPTVSYAFGTATTSPSTVQLRDTGPISYQTTSPTVTTVPTTTGAPISGNSHGGDVIAAGDIGNNGNTPVTEGLVGKETTGGSGNIITEAPIGIPGEAADGIKNGANFVLPTSSKARIQNTTTSTTQKASALPVLAGLGAAAVAAGIGVKVNNDKKKKEEEKKK